MTSKHVQQKPVARSNMNLSLPQPPGPICHKIGHMGAFGLRFWQSTYGWKDNLIRKLMEVVLHQNPPQNQQESSKQVNIQNLSRCCVTIFGPMGHVSSLSPLGGRI
jgi:hypothetical protein